MPEPTPPLSLGPVALAVMSAAGLCGLALFVLLVVPASTPPWALAAMVAAGALGARRHWRRT